MCLDIYIRGELKKCSTKDLIKKYRKVAKDDITVYKSMINMGNGKLLSFYRGKEYEIGYWYYQTGNFSKQFGIKRYPNFISISTGLHSYKTPNMFFTGVRCTIPKGSIYFEGNDGDIVSNNLIIEGILNHRI